MKVLVQWTLRAAPDWEEVDSAQWCNLPKLPEPAGGERFTGAEGWICALCVQGVIFEGWDHYAVVHHADDHIRVAVWNSDPDDWPEEELTAELWEFRPLAPDTAMGGAINTHQRVWRYAATEQEGRYPLRQFSAPGEEFTRHGIWIRDDHIAGYRSARKTRGWREWTEGISPDELDQNGHVKQQRPLGRYLVPDGTKTYYHMTTYREGVHVLPTDLENALDPSPGTPGEETSSVAGLSDDLAFEATTAPGEPGSAHWPTGNYRAQLDVVAAHASVEYGLCQVGLSIGHFARVASDVSADLETAQQQESPFWGTGLKLATTGVRAWAPGSAEDRLEILIAMISTAGHGQQYVTLQLGETDDYVDGPWSETAVPTNALFFGANF